LLPSCARYSGAWPPEARRHERSLSSPRQRALGGAPEPAYEQERSSHGDCRREQEQRVIYEARRLVAKIKAEEERGSPLHPAGHPDAAWRLSEGGYPAEYAALAHAIDELREEQ
jgi:hypothetical protein